MLTEQMLADSDLVLVATESLLRRVMQFDNADASKTKLMLGDTDLADPWGLSLEDYRDTASQLEPMVNRVIAEAAAK
jgi:protein-tyrosine-phosphatase